MDGYVEAAPDGARERKERRCSALAAEQPKHGQDRDRTEDGADETGRLAARECR